MARSAHTPAPGSELSDSRQVFFSYVGFDAVATAAEEASNPSRDLPLAILGGLGICTALYLGEPLLHACRLTEQATTWIAAPQPMPLLPTAASSTGHSAGM